MDYYYNSKPNHTTQHKGCRARRRAKQNADLKMVALKNAIQFGHECPILFVVLTSENSVVTDCCHVFSKTGLLTWKQVHTTCPICRRACHI